jgi:hypothetical protein
MRRETRLEPDSVRETASVLARGFLRVVQGHSRMSENEVETKVPTSEALSHNRQAHEARHGGTQNGEEERDVLGGR